MIKTKPGLVKMILEHHRIYHKKNLRGYIYKRMYNQMLLDILNEVNYVIK